MSKKKETFEHLHGKPTTRREFLATGLIPFAASAVMPSWLQIFAKAGHAQAAELVCGGGATSNLCSFIGLKLSGGMAMSSNFVPFDQGRQMLASYSKMGLGSGANLRISYEFANNAPFYEGSQFLTGLRQAALPETLKRASFVGVCVRAQDDSSMNKFDITGLVAKAGLSGKILPNLGRSNTDTGANNTYAYLRPSAPLVVGRYDDVANSLGVSGSLATLNANQRSKLFDVVRNLSSEQAKNIQGMTGGEVLGRLVQCANIDNTKLIQSGGNLNTNPLDSAPFAQVWGINNNSNRGGQDFVFATMVYNALNGNAGTVNLDIGGYDYHNGTRTSGDAKDLEAGVAVGRILQSLAVLGKKGFIVVTTDGGVSSPESDTAGGPWMSDRGIAGTAYMIGYDPVGVHQTKSFQLGHFTSGQVADDDFLTGGSAELAAGAMFANYLSFNGMLGQVESILPRVFSTADLDKVAIFG